MPQTKPIVSVENVVASASVDQKVDLNDITKKFPAGFRDYKLEDKVIKFWSDRNLPKSNISLDANNVKLSAESLSKIKLDPVFITKIKHLEEKSSKIHKKRLY